MNLKKKTKKHRTDTRAAQSLFRDCGNAVVRVTGLHTHTCTDLVSSQSCCPLPALRADMRKRSGVQILRALLSVEFIFLLTSGYKPLPTCDGSESRGGGNALQVVLAAFALRTSQANEMAEQLRKKKKRQNSAI